MTTEMLLKQHEQHKMIMLDLKISFCKKLYSWIKKKTSNNQMLVMITLQSLNKNRKVSEKWAYSLMLNYGDNLKYKRSISQKIKLGITHRHKAQYKITQDILSR